VVMDMYWMMIEFRSAQEKVSTRNYQLGATSFHIILCIFIDFEISGLKCVKIVCHKTDFF
ncbi:hypothetical protein ACJX0J_010653, partial [Zea mays]